MNNNLFNSLSKEDKRYLYHSIKNNTLTGYNKFDTFINNNQSGGGLKEENDKILIIKNDLENKVNIISEEKNKIMLNLTKCSNKLKQMELTINKLISNDKLLQTITNNDKEKTNEIMTILKELTNSF